MLDSAANIERQIEFYLRKYERAPHSRAFAPLADLYRKVGRIDEALEILAAGLVEHPQYVSALVIRGRCHLDAGQLLPAGEAFRRVLELDPDNLVALKQLAALAASAGDRDEACSLFDRVVFLDPTDEASAVELDALRGIPAAEPGPWTAPSPEAVAAAGSSRTETAASPESRPSASEPAPPEPAPRLGAASPPEPESAAESAPVEHAPVEPAPVEHAPVELAAPAAAGPAPAAPGPEVRERQSFATKTLAEIYLAQGYRDKALLVLRQILERHPDRDDVRTKIAELEAQPAAPASPPPSERELESAPASRQHFEAWLGRLARPEDPR